MLSFKNCNIYLNNKKVVKTNLSVKGDKFVPFKDNGKAITLSNKYIIVPGFIEQHIHGCNGFDVMDSNEKALHAMASSMTRDGVTSFLATTMTVSKKDIVKCLKVIANKQYKSNEAKILGIHLEGPFISKLKCGAQDPSNIIKPNKKDLLDFVKASKGKIKIITVAIEETNKEFFEVCAKNNILVSVGHSVANAKDLKSCLKYVRQSTHTYNAMTKTLDKNDLIPEIVKSNLYREIILDLFHVTKEQVLFIFNDPNKIILITDSMEGRYMPNGIYKLGGYDVYVKNGKALLSDGVKAGSILSLPQALRNVKKVTNLSFEQTINLVSKNIADNLKIKNIGCIKVGNIADFVVVDKNFNVYQTYVNGKLVFNKLS